MFVAIVVITFLLFFAIGFISYAFNSIGLYKISKREDEPMSILAWIPYLNKYILGRVAFKSTAHAVIMTILVLAEFISSSCILFVKDSVQVIYGLSVLSLILSLLTCIYTFIAHYNIFRKYSKSVVLMTILDVLSLGLLGPIFIFAIRDNDSKVDAY